MPRPFCVSPLNQISSNPRALEGEREIVFRLAGFATAQGVGGFVAGERFGDGVPVEFATELHADPRGGAGFEAAGGLLDGRDGLRVRHDAFEPVEMMILAGRPVNEVGRRGRQNFRIAGAQRRTRVRIGGIGIAAGDLFLAARAEHPAFVAFKANAVVKLVVEDHLHVVGVEHFHVVGGMNRPAIVGHEGGFGIDSQRSAEFLAHGPLGDVHVMRAPIGDHAQTEILGGDPAWATFEEILRMNAALDISLFRRAAEPAFVIEIGRHGHGRRRVTAGLVETHANFDGVQFADAAVAHGFAGAAEAVPGMFGTLLGARLQNHLGGFHRFAQADGLGDVISHRLLHVDVLARNGGFNGHERVPVIGHGHDHGVNFRRSQDIVIIVIGFERLEGAVVLAVIIFHQLFAGSETLGVQVAHGHDLADGLGHDIAHVAAPHAAAADLGDLEALARGIGAEQPGGDNVRQQGQPGGTARGGFEKTAA